VGDQFHAQTALLLSERVRWGWRTSRTDLDVVAGI